MRTQICSNEGPHLFSRRDNYEIAKSLTKLRNLILQNRWANFNQMGTKHPWVKGIQVCSIEEPFNSHTVNNVFFLLLINIMI